MPGHRIFIVLENPKERMGYTRFFEDLGYLVDAVPDGAGAIPHVKKHHPLLTIADIATPNFSAAQFIKETIETDFSCRTVILSKDPVVEHVVSLMKLGALDYLVKPVVPEQLELCAKRALDMQFRQKKRTRQPLPAQKKVKIITRDKGMENLLELVSKVADSSAAVLIQGESGTGKELFARHIHEESKRSDKPFIAVNCAALPENLLESELFGHEKGAFTGAISRKTGKFELADKGTLFLDEITEMQYHLQAKLLRVIQEKEVDRVGGISPVEVDVRIVATTNRDAQAAVEKGIFRQDLFYRLNTIPIVIPPLNRRQGDLELLCRFFIKKYCKIDGRNVKGLTNEALSLLKHHVFSGNVRELENLIHRAVLLADSQEIQPRDLLMDTGDTVQAQAPDTPDTGMDRTAAPTPASLKEMEKQMIFKTLDKTEGNRTHAAKILGISVRTLRNKLNEYKEKN